ncbi:hypothetical protein ASPCADRAFT_208472 [Aspergillus carbonarius ITEM 5010]|uniref:Uncharacterized protein n=1 Tax=Aspergillus carbonarius (strain ITEM 5010) TaxID=602072 RepID=A0A1R3RJZ9_ASPC5|nr:hypothetical protein ASPCADRAFT_208472 [Aspergillus carbonarius ITEM 5010]
MIYRADLQIANDIDDTLVTLCPFVSLFTPPFAVLDASRQALSDSMRACKLEVSL